MSWLLDMTPGIACFLLGAVAGFMGGIAFGNAVDRKDGPPPSEGSPWSR